MEFEIKLTEIEKDCLATVQAGFSVRDFTPEETAILKELANLNLIEQVWVATSLGKAVYSANQN